MFDRYAERAQRAVASAQQAALGFGASAVGTEHLLLGLLEDSNGLVVKVLHDLRHEPSLIKLEVLGMSPTTTPLPPGELIFSPRAKQVLVDLAPAEAKLLRQRNVGPEHLLLGLIREGEGVAAVVLDRFGISLEVARKAVERNAAREASASRANQGAEVDRVLRLIRRAQLEAQNLDAAELGHEHVLMALLADPEGADLADILRLRGVTLQWLRDQFRAG